MGMGISEFDRAQLTTASTVVVKYPELASMCTAAADVRV